MATKGPDRVPGRGEPDPENIRFRSFQGGAEARLTVGGAGSGLSGLPQANSGAAPAMFNNPEAVDHVDLPNE